MNCSILTTARPALWAAVLCALFAAAAPGGQPPTPGPIDFIPPHWTKFTIQWKPTWDETLAANPTAGWPATLAADAKLRHAADPIVALRKIELLKAMVQRFPAAKAQHADAYLAIAAAYRKLAMPQWSSWYAWKVISEFPDRKDLLPTAYLMIVVQPVGIHFPHGRKWAFAFDEAMSLAEQGVIPPGHDAARLACRGVKNLLCDQMRYDRFSPALARFTRLGATDPLVNDVAIRLLQFFGDGQRARALAPKGPEPAWWAAAIPDRPKPGSVLGMEQDRDLEIRVAAFQRGRTDDDDPQPVTVGDIQILLDATAGKPGYVRRSPSHYVSYRTEIERTLRSLPAERLAPLRTAHEKAAKFQATKALDDGNWGELIALLRRYPYSASLHRSLLAFGERVLRDGRQAQAAYAFRTVVALADDDALQASAHAGLWLAMASGGADRPALQQAMEAVPQMAQIPWRGQSVAAGQLKRELLAQAAAGAATQWPALAKIPRVRVALPAAWPGQQPHGQGPGADYGLHAPWPVTQVQETPSGLFLAGPGCTAYADGNGGKPTWLSAAEQVPQPWSPRAALAYGKNAWQYGRFPRRPVTVAGPRNSAVTAGGRALVRLAGWPPAVEALDARTGKRLWTTHARADWANLVVMTQPAAAYGQVHVLAVPGRPSPRGRVQSSGPWQLVCLAADDGRTLWKQSIGWPARVNLDVARYGSAVTVRRGAVFCSTNNGLIARCDAGDGRVDWVRGYAGTISNAALPHAPIHTRQGAGPIFVGDRMLVAPRDHSGVMALAADTGRMLWETIMVPSDRILGVSDRVVIAVSDQWLTGLDIQTGKALWFSQFPAGTGSQGAVTQSGVLIVSGDTLHRITPADGKTVEQIALDDATDADHVFLPSGRLLSLTAPPLIDSAAAPVKTAPLGLPLARVLTVACEGARLARTPAADDASGRFAVISGRRLACFQTVPALKPLWQRTLDRPPYRSKTAGDQLLLTTRRELTSLNLPDGTQRWSLELPFQPHAIGGDGKLVLALPGLSGAAEIAAIDPQAGKLLWTRSLAAGARFRGGIERVELRRAGPGPRTLKVGLSTLFADTGWRSGTVVLDRQTGKIKSITAAAPTAPEPITFAGVALRYTGKDPRVRTVPAGAAAKSGPLYTLPATGRQGMHVVLAFREAAGKLIVVSGVTGRRPQLLEGAYDAKDSRLYADLFDIASAKHVGRQELQGVRCDISTLTGYQTQVQIGARAIVATDITGVHVFTHSTP